jgi:transcriptional regulator with XRE-family HTH domain
MKAIRTARGTPDAVRRALEKLGRDISVCRRRRRLSMAQVAERTFVSRNTLTRVERGDPGVAIGTFATVLFALGMGDGMGDLADPRKDEEGLALDEEWLPQRIRTPLTKRASRKATSERE